MDPRSLARSIAIGRLGFGALLVATPGVLARAWIGETGDTPGAQALATAVGARDLALGAGVLGALSRGGARPWLIGSAAADFADLVGTLRARKGIPSTSVATLVVIA